MTDEINVTRNNKYHSVLDNPKYYNVTVFASIFIFLALCGWLLVFYMLMKSATIDTLDHLYLFLTSTGCLVMSVAYIVMRRKTKKLDQYQEEIIQCVYDTLELMKVRLEEHQHGIMGIDAKLKRIIEQNKKLHSLVGSTLYLQFRHYMCPTNEEFISLMNALEGDISKMDLPEELYQKLKDNYIISPLGIYKDEYWMIETGICSIEEYLKIYKKVYELHPKLKDLDRVPDLLLNVSDSLDNYQL